MLPIPIRQITHRMAEPSSGKPAARARRFRLSPFMASLARWSPPGLTDSLIGCQDAGAPDVMPVPVVSQDEVTVKDRDAAPGALRRRIGSLFHSRSL